MSGEMTIEDVCKFLDVSRQTVNNLVKRGALTKHQSAIAGEHGLRVYFLRSDVERLKRGTVRLSK